MRKKIVGFKKQDTSSVFDDSRKAGELLSKEILSFAEFKSDLVKNLVESSIKCMTECKEVSFAEARLNIDDIIDFLPLDMEELENMEEIEVGSPVVTLLSKDTSGARYAVLAAIEFKDEDYDISLSLHRYINGIHEVYFAGKDGVYNWNTLVGEFVKYDILPDDFVKHFQNRDVEAAFIQEYIFTRIHDIKYSKEDLKKDIPDMRKKLERDKPLINLMKQFPNNFLVESGADITVIIPTNWNNIAGMALSCREDGEICLHQYKQFIDYSTAYNDTEDDGTGSDDAYKTWDKIVETSADMDKIARFISMYCIKEYDEDVIDVIPLSFESVAVKKEDDSQIITTRDIRSLSGHGTITDEERKAWKDYNGFIRDIYPDEKT